jgi:restriction system protein
MAAKGVAGGFVVTSGSFTEEARSFANGRNGRLIDGPQLRLLV